VGLAWRPAQCKGRADRLSPAQTQRLFPCNPEADVRLGAGGVGAEQGVPAVHQESRPGCQAGEREAPGVPLRLQQEPRLQGVDQSLIDIQRRFAVGSNLGPRQPAAAGLQGGWGRAHGEAGRQLAWARGWPGGQRPPGQGGLRERRQRGEGPRRREGRGGTGGEAGMPMPMPPGTHWT